MDATSDQILSLTQGWICFRNISEPGRAAATQWRAAFLLSAHPSENGMSSERDDANENARPRGRASLRWGEDGRLT